MISEPKIIIFDSGLQIVADVEETDNLDALGKLKVHFPMEIMRMPVSMTHEAYSIRPWMSFSDGTEFEINKNNIVAIAPLSEGYREGYYNLKDGYFNKPEGLPSPELIDEYEEEWEENRMDEDTIKEMIDDIIGRKKRILH
tara:strand:- start:191 stop:613 length:423 start_codon:yes stop_codon:yes gene_type:complete